MLPWSVGGVTDLPPDAKLSEMQQNADQGGGVEKKFLETAYIFFCAANPRRVGGVRKFFPYTYDQKIYQTKLFQSKNSAR